MRKLLIIINFIAISITAFTQNQAINYVKDFNFLYKTIVRNSVTFKIYCEESGLDSVKLYNSLRKDLSANNSMEKFAEVSHKLFNASADMHNGFISPGFVKNTIKDLPQDEKEQTFLLVDTNYLSVSKEKYNSYKNARKASLNNINKLYSFYFDGEYFLTRDFKIDGQKFSRGTKISAINGIPTNQFYQKNRNNWFPFYDQKNKQFYARSLFNSIASKQNEYKLTFESENGDQQTITINKDTEITKKWKNVLYVAMTNQLKYFRKSKTLYVRYKTFAAFGDFINELEKYKEKEIQRVIVDVRGNGGGSDLQWLKFLSMLKPTYKINKSPKSVAFKQSVVNKFLSSNDIFDSLANEKVNIYHNDILEYIHPTKEKIEELGDPYKDFFEEHKNILNYEGKIYCLTDDRSFSASLTFASLKYFISDFYIVSDNIPFYGGMGLTPLMFMLPKSKLVFRLASNFDYNLYNSKQYRIEPDIEVNETLDDKLKWYNKRIRNYNSKKHRLQKSKYFKAIETAN